ncbi:hypothetical protein B0A79_23885 [Flavobacterium piscis]|uniref:HNH endonuclease n=1 Tax=Flavobacterium piscis TaxID=1114874 RepID=A0ABX2XJR3_9FLAO|nr:hypothetical protein [Flavobacterium piscis]OCB75556.1 hypothetical protein FLP_08805 [Flavobacterium piscis]OXE95933.1 hypothetical protein B0A79_23885 [Flavobacterium piscis]
MYKITKIEGFELTKETCFVCGKSADSREHIFPKWLQHKFNLWDQQITMANGTDISYRQLVVPCCKRCNTGFFSGLENKIANGTETDSDIWKWANKVHFALTLKDKFLDWDRKNPGYKIGDIISSSDPLEQSRHFLHCVSGVFKTDPDPFGSVFRFDFTSEQKYNFIHVINSSSICISFGDRGYVIFVRDGQFLKEQNVVMDDFHALLDKSLIEMTDMLFFYAKNIEYLERCTISLPAMIMPGKIVKLGRVIIRESKPVDKELLRAGCEWMGVTWIDPDDLQK